VPPHVVIDKDMPTAGLLAQVLVVRCGNHLPLYRQKRIFERAGLVIPQSTPGEWGSVCGVGLQRLIDALCEALLQQGVVHADETSVQMGFGSFSQGARAARPGRNPATGEGIKIAAAKTVKFTAGKAFRDAVNGA